MRALLIAAAACLVLAAPASAASTTLVINEVDYDQPMTDTAEFLELKNVSSAAINLDPYSLEFVNGNAGGATVYRTFELPDFALAAGDHYVVCANPANTPNCDLDVAPETDLIQNGAPDALGLRLGMTLVDAVSYEGNTGAPYTEGSGAGTDDGMDGISRCAEGSDTDRNDVDFILRPITPGAANSCPPPPPFGECGDGEDMPMYDIQGNGAATPYAGSQFVIEGVVVGDFQGSEGLGGFFVQEADADVDADPNTSNGLFVASGSPVDAGDVVRVQGTAVESFGRTQLVSVTNLAVCPAEGSVSTTPVALPFTSLAEWEKYEGMLVTITQSLSIGEHFNFDRFNETVLTDGRQYQPTAVHEPGSGEAAGLAEWNALRRITLDDGRNAQNPDPAIHPNGGIFDLGNRFRGGDTVANVTGVLDFAFGLYRIQQTEGADYSVANPRPDGPEDVGGNLTVGSFNVLNYFTTLDSRGANTPEEFQRQRTKIIAAITKLDADVVGLIEIENNDEAIADLVAGLNAASGAGTYAYIDTGVIGTDEIKVAFVYKPARVTPVGDHAILDSSVDPRFIDTLNRPALAQTFRSHESGGVFTAVVNHLKSKGSDCNAVGDPDTGDGSGNCNLTRTSAAEALVDWLASDPTGSGDDDVLIIGDLNSYTKEDPIDALLAGGYTDLVRRFEGGSAYSYVFDGQLGYLDHALAGEGLVDEVTGATEWHINADEPDLLDYDMTFKQPAQDALFEPNEFRSSDHDAVRVGIESCDEIAPTIDVSLSPDSLWPPKHEYATVQATIAAADDFDPSPAVTLVSATSNEPDDAPGDADGSTTDDVLVLDADTLRLRAERDETRSGRVYTITYRVTDDCGNSATDGATVTVPLGPAAQPPAGRPPAPVAPSRPGCAHARSVTVGTLGDDRRSGTALPDLMLGRRGADVLRGLGGADCLYGSKGADRLFGAGGRDRLFGGPGPDRMSGGVGGDLIDSGSGRDRIAAGAGNDRVLARGRAADTIDCGPGRRDVAIVDNADRTRRCERVRRP
jgi:predicted extracellular nuclease